MDIKQLIETIVSVPGRSAMGYIVNITLVMPNTNEHRRAITDAYGKVIDSWKYTPYYIEAIMSMFSVDDVVSFLFDCDIHLWVLESYEVNDPQFGYNYWNITLRR